MFNLSVCPKVNELSHLDFPSNQSSSRGNSVLKYVQVLECTFTQHPFYQKILYLWNLPNPVPCHSSYHHPRPRQNYPSYVSYFTASPHSSNCSHLHPLDYFQHIRVRKRNTIAPHFVKAKAVMKVLGVLCHITLYLPSLSPLHFQPCSPFSVSNRLQSLWTLVSCLPSLFS